MKTRKNQTSSPRFVVAEHSLLSIGAHYYEYNRRLMRAAQKRGYQTYLYVHRRYHGPKPEFADKIFPIYHMACHFNLTFPRAYAWLKSSFLWGKEIQNFLFPLKDSTTFTEKGSACSCKNQVDQNRQPQVKWKDLWKAVLLLPYQKLREEYFYLDTRRILLQNLSSSPIIYFFPTMSYFEWRGFMRLAQDLFLSSKSPFLPRLPHISFHFLFREESQKASFRSFRKCLPDLHKDFQRLQKVCPPLCLRFYTDTRDRAAKYNELLKESLFSSLPMPYGYPKSKYHGEKPLSVAYLGSGWWEKGFHHLPRIVQELDYLAFEGKIHFHFQCHLASQVIDSQTKEALEKLKTFSLKILTLYPRPLPSHEYENLFSQTHILLLPYDPETYRYRSSGLLIESLCRGIPVIVPKNTWLAKELTYWEDQVRSKKGSPSLQNLIFSYPQEIPNIILKLVNHYEEYREKTEQISDKILAYHNPHTLLSILESNGNEMG